MQFQVQDLVSTVGNPKTQLSAAFEARFQTQAVQSSAEDSEHATPLEFLMKPTMSKTPKGPKHKQGENFEKPQWMIRDRV